MEINSKNIPFGNFEKKLPPNDKKKTNNMKHMLKKIKITLPLHQNKI